MSIESLTTPAYTVFITGCPHFTPELTFIVWSQIGCVQRARNRHDWRILTTDSPGIDALITTACNEFAVPVQVFGTSAKPRNAGVARRSRRGHTAYTQIAAGGSWLERARAVQRALVNMADVVICVGEHPDTLALFEFARGRGKQVNLLSIERAS